GPALARDRPRDRGAARVPGPDQGDGDPGEPRDRVREVALEVRLVPAGLHRPVVALADHAPVRAEAEERDPGERLLVTVHPQDRPVLDGGSITADDRLAEAALDELLVRERAQRVLARAPLGLAERV